MGKYLLNHLRRITLLFACLKCDQYTIANIYNLHVLTYHQEERRLPFADLIANDVQVKFKLALTGVAAL